MLLQQIAEMSIVAIALSPFSTEMLSVIFAVLEASF